MTARRLAQGAIVAGLLGAALWLWWRPTTPANDGLRADLTPADRQRALAGKALFHKAYTVAEGLGPEMAHDFVAMYLRSGNGLRAEDGHDALYTYDIQERLPQLQCPTLLIYGTGDEYFARREITAKLIRRCRVEVIEGARSLAMYTHPQQYADAILRFLAQPGV